MEDILNSFDNLDNEERNENSNGPLGVDDSSENQSEE